MTYYAHSFFALAVIFGWSSLLNYNGKGKKVKISLLQAVEAHMVARGQGSHIT
jgi:hypothetical protein